MRTPAQQLRCQLDKLRKHAKRMPGLPTGGDSRSMEEVGNTSANAKLLADMAWKKKRPPVARLNYRK